ncbi:MAG TPA: ribbon-helix-helix protein, CopG family [Xanthomonadaceae bacterium]|nr:ribbon-helix-helix protein, CopG family [Xanthomonadaceae bacterium]
MNFNVYIDDATAKRLGELAKRRRQPRNALVREAVAAYLEAAAPAWPRAVLEYAGDPGATPFEQHREALAGADDDPFEPRA